MRLLRVTTTEGTFDVDLDDKTAIGISLQAYDIKEPGKRKINVSNSFTVPGTANNMKIFGYAGNSQFTSTAVYSNATCDYWIDNIHLIKNSRVRFEEYEERISLFIFEKASIWDELKLLSWSDFVDEYNTWLQTSKGLPDYASPFTGTWQEFVDYYSDRNNAHCLFISMFFGNLYDQPDPDNPGTNYETEGVTYPTIYLSVKEDGVNPLKSGHFCTYVKNIFEFIEYKYDVNFYTGSPGEFFGNIWDDEIVEKTFIPLRDIEVRPATVTYPAGDFYFDVSNVTKYSPLDIINDKAGKTLHDYVNAFFQHFNIIIDKNTIDENDTDIKLRRFDLLTNYSTIKDWSDLSTDRPKFKPYIDGYARENYIKFKEIYPDGDDTQNQKVIECNNVNIDAREDLFEIDSYVNNLYLLNDGSYIPNLTVKESFKTFNFFVPDDTGLVDFVNIYFKYVESGTTLLYAYGYPTIPVMYSLDSEYQLLEEILTNPIYYEVKKWLTLHDITELEFFKKYYIRELNGCFFLNKVSGFNPEKSNEPTTLELIKVSDETPLTPYVDYWVDGIGAIWTDGLGNYYY